MYLLKVASLDMVFTSICLAFTIPVVSFLVVVHAFSVFLLKFVRIFKTHFFFYFVNIFHVLVKYPLSEMLVLRSVSDFKIFQILECGIAWKMGPKFKQNPFVSCTALYTA